MSCRKPPFPVGEGLSTGRSCRQIQASLGFRTKSLVRAIPVWRLLEAGCKAAPMKPILLLPRAEQLPPPTPNTPATPLPPPRLAQSPELGGSSHPTVFS